MNINVVDHSVDRIAFRSLMILLVPASATDKHLTQPTASLRSAVRLDGEGHEISQFIARFVDSVSAQLALIRAAVTVHCDFKANPCWRRNTLSPSLLSCTRDQLLRVFFTTETVQ